MRSLALAATLIAAPLGGAVAAETFTVFDLAYKGSEQYTGPGGGTTPGDMLVWNNPLLPSTRARRSAPPTSPGSSPRRSRSTSKRRSCAG